MIVEKVESVTLSFGDALSKKMGNLSAKTGDYFNKKAGNSLEPAKQIDLLPEISQAAMDLHKTDQIMEYMEKVVTKMKDQLVEMRRTLPPFSPEDAERVRILRGYIGLRKLIDELTIPPPDKEKLKEGVDLPQLNEKSPDQEVDGAVKVLEKTVEIIRQKRVFIGTRLEV